MGFFGIKNIDLLLEATNSEAGPKSLLTFVNPKNKNAGFYVYHGAYDDAIDNIEQVGNRREWNHSKAGNMYGDGIYTTYTLPSTFYNLQRNKYGQQIAKLHVVASLDKFVIFDGYVCRQWHGHDISIDKQLENIFNGAKIKGTPVIDLIRSNYNYSSVTRYYSDTGYTSVGAVNLWDILESIEDRYKFNTRKYIEGLIFSGSRDGNVCVIYDFSKAYTASVSHDKGRTFVTSPNIDQWRKEAVFKGGDLIKVLRFEYNYFRTYGFVDGYAIVGKSTHGPYRILSHYLFNRKINGDGRISNLWFDDVQGQSFTSIGNDRVIQVTYKGKRYTIKQDDVEKQQYSVYDNGIYVCDLKDLEQYTNQPKQTNPINNNINTDFSLDDSDIDDFLNGLNI